MGNTNKTATVRFGYALEGVSSFVIFAEVHGYKYSSFYLFDELFRPFHVIFSHSSVHGK